MKYLILKLIRFYQRCLSTSKACRFRPTCSEYVYQAIAKYDIISGGLKGLRRIFKCHPWHKGGWDPLE